MPDENKKELRADMLFEIVKAKYGARLTDEQLEEVRSGVDGVEGLAAELRKVRLTNAVEPFANFQPFRGADNDE